MFPFQPATFSASDQALMQQFHRLNQSGKLCSS